MGCFKQAGMEVSAAAMHRLGPRMRGLPPGRRVYAVGDVHGHLDRLQAVHAAILADLAARPVADAVLVHLGDLIDRGPDSAGVVAHVLAGAPGLAVVNLMGNHERMLLDALSGGSPDDADNWLRNGGWDSLRSWGISPRVQVRDWEALLPASHLLFLQGLLPLWSTEGLLCVHAGVRPGVALPDQVEDDLLWIREEFLGWPGMMPMLPDQPDTLIVHGHTPRPALRPNRLGIDTGAGRGGRLTCAVLERDEVRFLQA